MADPLKLLQEYATGRRDIREVKHDGRLYYVFDDVAYPSDAKTNLSVYSKPDEYYTIEAILYFWRNHDAVHTAYVKDASGKGIQPITRAQRRELAEYLRGAQTALPKDVQFTAPVPAPIPASRLLSDATTHQHQQHHQQGDGAPSAKRQRMDTQEEQQAGHRLDKILDQSLDRDDASAVRGLSSDLPAEKIALLRTRVKKNLKNIVKPIEEEGLLMGTGAEPLLGDASSDSIGRQLKEKERVWRTRITCLESMTRDFSGVLTTLSALRSRDSNRAKVQGGGQPMGGGGGGGGGAQGQAGIQAPPMVGTAGQNGKPRAAGLSSGYSRYDQEIFQKEPLADFNIDTNRSFAGNSLSVLQQQQQQKAMPFSAQRAGIICGSGGVVGGGSGRMAPIPQQQQRPQKRVSRTPIIIIPATGTALITMYNAVDILQDLKYVPTEEKKLTCRRENEVLIQRPKETDTVPYRVLDNPLKLREDEWERVVAVFVQGPAWQFKGWQWGGNPVEIFANIAAFHLKFEEQKLDSNVGKWNVNVLSLSKNRRHLDRAILHKFWDVLDRYIAKHKPFLRS